MRRGLVSDFYNNVSWRCVFTFSHFLQTMVSCRLLR